MHYRYFEALTDHYKLTDQGLYHLAELARSRICQLTSAFQSLLPPSGAWPRQPCLASLLGDSPSSEDTMSSLKSSLACVAWYEKHQTVLLQCCQSQFKLWCAWSTILGHIWNEWDVAWNARCTYRWKYKFKPSISCNQINEYVYKTLSEIYQRG